MNFKTKTYFNKIQLYYINIKEYNFFNILNEKDSSQKAQFFVFCFFFQKKKQIMTSVKHNIWTKDRCIDDDDDDQIPKGRFGHTCIAVGPKMLIFGGSCQLEPPFENDCWAYNMGIHF